MTFPLDIYSCLNLYIQFKCNNIIKYFLFSKYNVIRFCACGIFYYTNYNFFWFNILFNGYKI